MRAKDDRNCPCARVSKFEAAAKLFFTESIDPTSTIQFWLVVNCSISAGHDDSLAAAVHGCSSQ